LASDVDDNETLEVGEREKKIKLAIIIKTNQTKRRYSLASKNLQKQPIDLCRIEEPEEEPKFQDILQAQIPCLEIEEYPRAEGMLDEKKRNLGSSVEQTNESSKQTRQKASRESMFANIAQAKTKGRR